jgi:putative nucleotidyltransferase with HDIG domain
MGLVAAMTGPFFLKDVHSRSHLWRQLFIAGLLPVFAGMLARWTIALEMSWQVFLFACLGEALWGTVVIAFLPIWENFFDIMSPLRLMELSYPTQPLLKKLQIEAPGTYHHSLMVGTLAETAADRLGMNAYLVRAGAYYHDIGKLRRPHFFVENQMEGENVHDELTPSLSALVIIAHVREGLEIAEEYNLPGKLRQFIAEHHGTTCLSYFFRKSSSQGEKLPREQFCYPGPRPSSRETALLMLADSVEAAVRADRRNISGIQDLEKVISGVVESKVVEGQLDDVDFTLKDLAEIKEALIYALQSVYHGRKVKEIQSSDESSQSPTPSQGEGGENSQSKQEE